MRLDKSSGLRFHLASVVVLDIFERTDFLGESLGKVKQFPSAKSHHHCDGMFENPQICSPRSS